jgi:8-oxo-dGTP pyrophosphatase MutT (NUDIX family)
VAKRPEIAPKRSAAAALAGPGHPPSRQVGALCYRRKGKGARILLITSRDTGRWVIPKGWPMHNRSEAEAAAREAFEEAGLKGEVAPRSVGHYVYAKKLGRTRFIPCLVRVYPMKVREMLKQYPESGQRRVKWFSPKKAARKVDEPDLSKLIRKFGEALGAPE